jgi:hypothetical protein
MSFFGDASFQQMMNHRVDFRLAVRRTATLIVVVELMAGIGKKAGITNAIRL